MTLRKKGIITQSQGIALYAAVLVLGIIVIVDDLRQRGLLYIAITFGNVVALLRFELRICNKYVLWLAVVVALHLAFLWQDHEQEQHSKNDHGQRSHVFDNGWCIFFATISTFALFLGASKRQVG